MLAKTQLSALLGMLCFLAGCNSGPVTDYSSLGLVATSGTVTLDEEPVSGAAVFLYTEDETYCFGVTDRSGNYTIMLNSEKSGCTPGEKRVEIWTTRNPLGDAAGEDEATNEDPDWAGRETKQEKIPACYNSGSKLSVTIESSDSGLDFNLKSDCSVTGAE